MRHHLLSSLVVLTLIIGGRTTALAIKYNFHPINYPGASATYAEGINNTGQIVGWYTDLTGTHGFVVSRQRFFVLDFPGAGSTSARGINDHGDIVGIYSDTAGADHGFFYTGGTYSSIDYPPNAVYPVILRTLALGINNSGDIVGGYDPGGLAMAFLLRGGSYVDLPGTLATGINNTGDVVAFYQYFGDFWVASDCGPIIYPPEGSSVISSGGLNDNCDVVGWYYDYSADPIRSRGFVSSDGTFNVVDFPTATDTFAKGINNADQVVGYYQDGAGTHGFIAIPVTPTPTPSPTATPTPISSSCRRTGPYVIQGRVTTDARRPISGVALSLTGPGNCSDSTRSGPRGTYRFGTLGNGTYTLTPSKLGCTITPTNKTVTISGRNATVNFTGSCP